jgi:hypothetical protein
VFRSGRLTGARLLRTESGRRGSGGRGVAGNASGGKVFYDLERETTAAVGRGVLASDVESCAKALRQV